MPAIDTQTSKPHAPFNLTPDTRGLIHLSAAYTPTSHVHAPDSAYVRWYWLTDLGPTTYLTWTTLTLWLPTNDHATVPLAYTELAHSLGTAPGRLTRALSRLAAYRLGHTIHDQPHTLYLKRAAPPLSAGQRTRLAERCPTLAADHQRHHAA